MLIALSGKIQSGKDTIGKIIQYLIVKTKENSIIATEGVYSPTSLEDFEAFCKCDTDNLSNWHIVKFADALKDTVCVLTGCTREQLESDEFKTSKLSDEWIRYGYADGFIKTYIGNGEMSGAIMNNKQCSKEEYEEHYKINWQTAYKSHLTYRELLQYLGTDLLRNQLHDDVWINALFSKYKPHGTPYNSLGDLFDDLKHCPSETKLPNWIITDTRFPNELKAVKDRGGITIRVNRIHNEKLLHDIAIASAPFGVGSRMIEQNKSYNHPSETALDDYPFDYTISNDSTIEELIEQVKVILIKEQIL